MQLHESQYPRLLTYMERHKPFTHQIIFGLKIPSPVGAPERTYWVDKWPDVSMVLQVIKYDDVEGLTHVNLFLPEHVSDTDGKKFIESCPLIDWSRPIRFTPNQVRVNKVLASVVITSGASAKLSPSASVYEWSGNELEMREALSKDLERLAKIGYEVGSLREDDIGYLLENWKFGTPDMHRYMLHLLREAQVDRACMYGIYETSVGGVAGRSSKPVSYSLMFPDGIIGGMMTLPGHRRKGLARTIAQLGISWCISKGIAPMCFIEDENHASVSLFLKLGFQLVHGFKVMWLFQTPSNG